MLDNSLDAFLDKVKHNLRKAQEVFDFSLEAWLLSLECLMVDCLDPAHYKIERLHKDAEVVWGLEKVELEKLGSLLQELGGLLTRLLGSQEME